MDTYMYRVARLLSQKYQTLAVCGIFMRATLATLRPSEPYKAVEESNRVHNYELQNKTSYSVATVILCLWLYSS